MTVNRNCIIFSALVAVLPGCAPAQPPDGKSDPAKVRSADVSILFVGNSHTIHHDLPDLICKMIRFRDPKKAVYSHVVFVSHLDAVTHDPRCGEEIETRPWKFVVLQAQRISVGGKHEYSRKEGIDLAKLAKERGAQVFFYSEWGLKDVAGDGARNEKIYQEMADEAGVRVAPVNRAWDLALVQRPDLPLHEADGNHQSKLGAFLTACVLFERLTGENPAPLAAFPYAAANEADRKFLADAAAKALDHLPAGNDIP
jgi:hypothetical protein